MGWPSLEGGAQRFGRWRSWSKLLYVDIEVETEVQMPYPVCARLCPLRDHLMKRWQRPTYLGARMPRV
ncbi:MAG: hypothetical protein JNM65_05685 [Verrucomicrobiaceae bacterium]|nr:hypothetical protein [Verrucomicrobiaceae bacterium]